MSWCPNCKNEYVEGKSICTDCGVELVDSLDGTSSEPIIFGEQEQMEKILQFLTFNHIMSGYISYDEAEDVYELSVSSEDRRKASMAIKVFLQEEGASSKDILPKDEKNIPGYPMPTPTRNLYQNSAKQAEENRSSAYMLLIIGGIGLAIMIMIFIEVIPLSLNPFNKYMMCGVMSVLFMLFIVMGFVSMKSSKVLAQKAESEHNLTSEIRKWCEDNMAADKIDEGLFGEEKFESEEIKYFKRTEKMKEQISYQFLNLDEGFLDTFVDDYYPIIFE